MTTEHIVQAYDDELSHLTTTILQMGGLVESQVSAAMEAIKTRDSAKAEKIISKDLSLIHI